MVFLYYIVYINTYTVVVHMTNITNEMKRINAHARQVALNIL